MPYSNIAVDELLINAPYYQGFQAKVEADELLPNKNGTFLVRLIEQKPGELVYIVSVYWKDRKRHFKIFETWNNNKKYYYFVEKAKRTTIPELIRFHRFTQTPICRDTGVKLRGYVGRTNFSLYREQLKIKDELGHGEFGEVRKGKLRLGLFSSVDVAIKQDKVSKDPNARIRFLREANVMMRLRHRNIVRLYGVVVFSDPILIVTEYAAGGALLGRLREEKPPTKSEKIRFSRDISHGMAYLEYKMVMHRDLAVRNCLLDANGTVKIADFGLSLRGRSHYTNTSAKAPMRQLAPETLKCGLFSFKTDVWSYGVVLFEIWKFPYEEPYQECQDNIELRKKILHEGLRLQPPDNMPNKLKELMSSCHRTDPDERPTFAEIKEKYFWREERHCREDMSQICNSILQLLAI